MQQLTGDLWKEGKLTSDAATFRRFLEINIRQLYSFLMEHPRYRKILFWEAAEEWKTWNQIAYRPDDMTQLRRLAEEAQRNGLLRRNLDPGLFPIVLMHVTASTLLSYSRFGEILGDTESHGFHEHMADQLVEFIVRGMMEPSVL